MLLSAECRADWKFTPQMELRETYSDNANQQHDDQARGSWISEADPAFTLTHNGPRLKFSAAGEWQAFAYSQKNLSNVHNSSRHYQAASQADLIDQLLYVDASASSTRQAVSAFGPVSSAAYSSVNSTQVSTWSISPYLRHRFGSSADLTARYTRDAVNGDVSGFGSSMGSTRTVNLASGPTFNDIGWNLAYNHQDLNAQYAGRSMSENDQAGIRWNLVRRFALTTNVGYDKYDYQALNERNHGRSWSGGFVWVPSTRTSVQASIGRRYFGKTGALDASYRTQHSVWSVTYDDQVSTSRSQFLLPSTVDTASMLDRLFAAAYPDATLRQQAVQAYMASLGLPPTLTTNINYLSNRYIRDKRLQSAVTFTGARSALALSVFRDERVALSRQTDGELLSSQLSALNDNIRQRGVSANFDYRLSTRTSASANLYAAHVLALTTGQSSNNRELRLGLAHRFDTKTRGSLELRHTTGRVGLVDSGGFHENALMATLTVLY